ncbi:CHAT domain-containing protein [Paenarthrobacter sp. Y-19]|uniref:CHAT domain-containing protein n=1 Tax=Paenarthrobacter sp. Y-19 TaxID=3031125 RepID=UPI0023D97C99|nr:CHAT domain-containing protein [Paenarthrobacter sp. Y-19]
MDCDIELEIDAGSARGEYTVHVVRAPAGGHASGAFTLDVDGIQDRLPQLEATVLASAVAARRTLPIAEVAVREVGQELFQALFTREVYGTYRASLGATQHSGQQLRVVLRLAAPELAMMPWETLFDPGTETYLCQTEPLIRHIPAPDYNQNPLDVAPPLRILGIVASPRDLPALDVETEKDHLGRALAGPMSEGRVELVWSKTGTWDDVQSMLLAGPWHVVHFVGHGDYDPRTDEGRIALVGQDGRAAMVRAVRLMALLSVASPRPRLVVLNSCSSGEMGQTDLFSGTAAALVRSGIGAVAAMQFAISDAAAIAFAHGFYAAIANGRTVDEAARVGRISVMASPDGTLEWVTPALYVRGGSTQLFTLTGPPRAPAYSESTTAAAASGGKAAVPPPAVANTEQAHTDQAMKRAQLRALYVQATAELRARRFEQAVELFEDLLTLEPGYRDAATQRDAARRRLELARIYREALQAEESGDWLAAADGFALVLDDPEYPGAAARKQDCERKQRVSDLEGELRYHSSQGSWQAVLDVSSELASVDPSAADPGGLATAARAEIEKAKPKQTPSAEESQTDMAGTRGSYTTVYQPPPQPRAAPLTGVPASNIAAAQAGQSPVTSQPGASAPLNAVPLAWGGAVLAVAGGLGVCFAVYFLWFDDNYWYESGGDASLRILYGLVAPLGYLLLAVAGLPDRTIIGRLVMAGVVVSGAVFGLSGLNYSVELTAVVFSFVHAGFGLCAGILALRSRQSRLMGWLLLWPTQSVPLVWVQDKGVFLESWYRTHAYFALIQLFVVCAAGMALLVASRRLRARSTERTEK